ncbi:MAG TPA: acetyltransferase [Thermosynechococcaceae cyanobacterium]
MLLHDKKSGTLVEILEVDLLFDPTEPTITAKIQDGQEEQDPEKFAKENLAFPSGESLPRCWLDADYRLQNAPGN